MDIKLSRFLDFNLDDRNDMPLTEEEQEVEQAIAIAVHDTYYEQIGTVDRDNVISFLERQAKRAMKRTDYADRVRYINGRFSEDEPNKVIMEIAYLSGELSEIPVDT